MRTTPPVSLYRHLVVALRLLALLCLLQPLAAAQSTSSEFPTPVRDNQISGSIQPRDLGDARLTSYFYAFNGTPGDLIVTVESSNLEGDVDVFTAGTLRPLAKVSMYGGTGNRGTKTIFLRTRESLILRVEARTPNDAEGTFRVRFDGAFEPYVGEAPTAPEIAVAAPSTSTGRKGRRVNSVGARIEEPEPEPEPATASAPAETASPSAKTPTATSPDEALETAANTGRTTTARPTTPRTRRNTRPSTARTAPRTTRTRPSTTARRTQPPPEPQPATAPEPASGPRLIIETRDGTRVERFMSTVRRVTVENGQIVVITRDGKVDRQPMSNVLRMAIEP